MKITAYKILIFHLAADPPSLTIILSWETVWTEYKVFFLLVQLRASWCAYLVCRPSSSLFLPTLCFPLVNFQLRAGAWGNPMCDGPEPGHIYPLTWLAMMNLSYLVWSYQCKYSIISFVNHKYLCMICLALVHDTQPHSGISLCISLSPLQSYKLCKSSWNVAFRPWFPQ